MRMCVCVITKIKFCRISSKSVTISKKMIRTGIILVIA